MWGSFSPPPAVDFGFRIFINVCVTDLKVDGSSDADSCFILSHQKNKRSGTCTWKDYCKWLVMESCGIFSKESSCENLGIFINNGPDGRPAGPRPRWQLAVLVSQQVSLSVKLRECCCCLLTLFTTGRLCSWIMLLGGVYAKFASANTTTALVLAWSRV